jgi:hypothetical protein
MPRRTRSTIACTLLLAATAAVTTTATAAADPAPASTPGDAPAADDHSGFHARDLRRWLLGPAVPETPGPGDPLAGYNGSFFLRDPHNWFVLYPKGRLQVDSYNFPGRGDPPPGVDPNTVGDPRPRGTIFVRRIRPEIQGTIANHFDFQFGGEFGSTPTAGQYGTLTDAYVIVNYSPVAQLQIGQYDVPFTLENRTSDKYFDFMERSLAVRAFGVPANKDAGAMLWGYAPNRLLYYSIGVFNGDGQSFKNQDSRPALIGRAFVAPLAPWARGRRWMQEAWVGGSFWWQDNTNLGLNKEADASKSTTGASANDLLALTTQGGLGFFSSNYGNKDSMGNAIRSHLAPNGQTLKGAVEANIPWQRFGLRFEWVHQSVDLSRYDDSNPMNAAIVRAVTAINADKTGAARLQGDGLYVELWAWVWGNYEMLEPPGIEPHPRLKPWGAAPAPQWGVMAAAKIEHVGFDVTGLPTTGQCDNSSRTGCDPAQGHYAIDAFEVGVNAWLTRHVRLTANYVLNYLGGFGTSDNKDPKTGVASDPSLTNSKSNDAKNAWKNWYYGKAEHELLFRVAIAL